MSLALGRHLLFHRLANGSGLVLVIAVIAVVLLVRFWPQISNWLEGILRR